jgi:hypothetical protein
VANGEAGPPDTLIAAHGCGGPDSRMKLPRIGIILRNKSLLLVAFLAIPVLLIASSPKMLVSWRNPSYSGGHFKNILVLALNGKAESRAEFEDVLVAAIARPGIQATQSYEFLPRPDVTPIDINDLKAVMREQKFDAIIVARLVKAEKKITYVPGEFYTPPFPYYGTFYGYYGAVYPIVYSPGYLRKESIAQVETNFYSATKPDGELVWNGTTNTFDAHSPMKVIKKLVKVVIKELEKQTVIDRVSFEASALT